MVTMHQVLAFGLVALVVIAIPGPSVVFTIGRALTYGRAVALTTVVGNSLGLLTALVLVVLGLGELVATSEVVFELVKIGGACYLVYLGIQALRHRHGITVSAERKHLRPAAEARSPPCVRASWSASPIPRAM